MSLELNVIQPVKTAERQHELELPQGGDTPKAHLIEMRQEIPNGIISQGDQNSDQQSMTNVRKEIFVLKQSKTDEQENVILPAGEEMNSSGDEDGSVSHNTVQVEAIDTDDEDEFMMPNIEIENDFEVNDLKDNFENYKDAETIQVISNPIVPSQQSINNEQ